MNYSRLGVLGALAVTFFGWHVRLRRRFLTATERQQIAAALEEARRHTRARIGLSIDEQATADPQVRAHRLFGQWDLPETERPTAVLVYVSARSRAFAVVGGDEVRRVAPRTFWEAVNRDLHHHFDEGRYCDGIFKAVAQVALQLERFFPREPTGSAEASPSTPEGLPATPEPADPAE
jgi:uncharacterized membrane protein YgcG